MSSFEVSVVNRQHRDGLAGIVQEFLQNEIDVVCLFEAISVFRQSEDSTVVYVANAINLLCFEFEDDIGFESASEFTKSQWDYVQRLLLVLRSDKIIESHRIYHWSIWQAVAGFALITFIFAGWCLGFGQEWFLIAIPFSIVSLMISLIDRPKTEYPFVEIVTPFDSISSLANTIKSVGFVKLRHPGGFQRPRKLSVRKRCLDAMSDFVFWGIIFPTVLYLPFQTLPRVEISTRVV